MKSVNLSSEFSHSSIHNVLKKYDMKLPMYAEIHSMILEEMMKNKEFEDEKIETITEELLYEINRPIKKDYTSDFGIFVDMEEFRSSSSSSSAAFLYKLLINLYKKNDMIVVPKGVELFKLILINLKDEDINSICQFFNEDIGTSNIQAPFPIILMGKQWKIQVLYGKSKEELWYSNQRLHSAYLSNNCFEEEKKQIINLPDEVKNNVERLIKPFDLMIKKNGETLFESFVDNVLEIPIESEGIGCKINIPTKIGSKLYIENYYEADFMFQNNFFVDRFAYFIAKDIIYRISNKDKAFYGKDLVLIGYNPYSTSLVERVKSFVNTRFPKKIKDTIIAKEKEKGKGLEFNNMLSDSINKYKTNKCNFITIVPIACTLSTTDKIIALFTQHIGKHDVEFVQNYVVVLVRDDLVPQPTKNEIYRNWRKNGLIEHTINTVYRKTEYQEGITVKFLIQKAGRWHNLIDKYTFPKKWWDEKYINQTKNASLNIKNLLGRPISAMPDISEIIKELPWTKGKNDDRVKLEYFNVSVRRLWEIRKFIYFGHIEHGGSHYKYYFDIERIFASRLGEIMQQKLYNRVSKLGQSHQLDYCKEQIKTHKSNKESYPSLIDWLKYIKERSKHDFLNVIISPDNDFESCFVSTINKIVFDDDAFVIFVSINDSLQNNKLKLSYLQNVIPTKARYYFVDHAMVTGNTYQKTKSYMASILGINEFKFDGIITVINRLSQNKYDEIRFSLKSSENDETHIFSFLHFFVLPSKESDKNCSLCNLFDLYSRLKEYSFNEDCRKEIELNKEKFELQTFSHYLDEGKDHNVKKPKRVSENNRYWLRMLRRHQLYFELARLEISENSNYNTVFRVLSKLYNEKVPKKYNYDELDYKISFLKAITFPPLSQYVIIRKCALKIQLKELHNLFIKKEDPKIDDLTMLLVILKHLAMLGSNALVREDVILKSWNLYCKVIKSHGNENLNIRFKQRFVFYLKLATYKDEAKSIWIGELLRTGHEMKVKDYSKTNSFKVSKTVLFNDIFSYFSSVSKRGWLPLLFYDNTAITRKTLDNFELALAKNKRIKQGFYNEPNNTIIGFDEFSKEKNIKLILTEYRKKIDSEYYYSWFRHFLNENNNTTDGVPILKKFIYVLYARLLIKNFLISKQNIESFDNNAKSLLIVAAQIMDANAAFISIKAKSGETMYVLAKHNLDNDDLSKTDDNRLYCRKLLFEKTIEKGRPFVIRKEISDDEDSYLRNSSFKSATYLMLNGTVKMNPSQESLVGVVTFLYDRKDSDDNDVFMINAQESGRLLLLLKPQMDEYVKHVADEKQFEVWKEKQKFIAKYDAIFAQSRHAFADLVVPDLDALDNYERVPNTFYRHANNIITNLYAEFECNRNYKIDEKYLDDIYLSDILEKKFERLIKSFYKWEKDLRGTFVSPIFDYDPSINPHEIKLHTNKFILQSYIFMCLHNAFMHYRNSNKKIWIKISQDKNGVFIEIINDLPMIQKDVFNNQKDSFDALFNVPTWENVFNDFGNGITISSLKKCYPNSEFHFIEEENTDDCNYYFRARIYLPVVQETLIKKIQI